MNKRYPAFEREQRIALIQRREEMLRFAAMEFAADPNDETESLLYQEAMKYAAAAAGKETR